MTWFGSQRQRRQMAGVHAPDAVVRLDHPGRMEDLLGSRVEHASDRMGAASIDASHEHSCEAPPAQGNGETQ